MPTFDERMERVRHLEKMVEDHKRKQTVRSGEEAQKYEVEVAALERRVLTMKREIPLGDGDDTIEIWTHLSDRDMRRLGKLERERTGLSAKLKEAIDKGEEPEESIIDRADRIGFEILEMITVNPTITAKWLEENRDKVATQDLLTVTLAYYQEVGQRTMDTLQAQKFRRDGGGPDIRAVPP